MAKPPANRRDDDGDVLLRGVVAVLLVERAAEREPRTADFRLQALAGLAKQRKVKVLRGTGTFLSPHRLAVVAEDGTRQVIGFDQCIIAAGSEPVKLPGIPEDPRILDSSSALEQ